jgi:hypothetical protein
MLRVSLARSVEEFETQVQGRRDTLQLNLHIDFAFIAGYWLVFATMSALFALRGFRWSDWLGAVAGELATIGALADVSENVFTLRLLRRGEGTPGDDLPAKLATSMRRSSLVKWSFLFAAVGLLSVMFFQRGGANIVLGAVYAATAALGLATIAADAGRLKIDDLWLERMLRVAFLGNCIVLLVGLPVAAAQL